MIKPEKIYECKLVNNSTADWTIMERGGIPMLKLLPGGETILRSFKPYENLYSRYSLVRRNGDSTITVELNPNWPRPESWEGKRLLELKNDGPNENEGIRIGENAITLYRGLPFVIPIDIDEHLWIWYSKVRIVEIEEKLRDPERPEYLVKRKKIIQEKTLRPKAELIEIKREINELMARRGMSPLRLPPEVKNLEI